MDNSSHNNTEGLLLLRFLFRWRKILIATLLISLATSVIATLLMEPKYTSTGIIFPTPTNSPEKLLDEPQFGYEVDADWLMQILKSDIVKDTMVSHFDLVNYFGLDTTRPGWHDELTDKYQKMLDFNRTRYMSIEISATTSDPELSAKIVNTIIDRIDGIRERIFKSNTFKTMIHFEEAYLQKNQLVNTLMDSIHLVRDDNTATSLDLLYQQMRKKQEEVDKYSEELSKMRNEHDFYDLSSHIEILSSKLAGARSEYAMESGKYEILSNALPESDTALINTRARLSGAKKNIQQFENEINGFKSIKKHYFEIQSRLNAGISQLNQLRQQYENMNNAFEPYVNSIRLERLSSDYTHEQILLNELRYKYEEALLNYESPIPSVYVIDRAEPSYEKSSPSFIINAVIIVFASLILMIGILLFLEKIREIGPAIRNE